MVVSSNWCSANNKGNKQALYVFDFSSGSLGGLLATSTGQYGNLENIRVACSFNTGNSTKIALHFYSDTAGVENFSLEYRATITDIRLVRKDINVSGATIRVEVGDIVTEYTAYENGIVKGIVSNGERLVLSAEDGVVIACEYFRPPNEYDRFWDAYQDYGKRTDCRLLFGGHGWSKRLFRPKYDIRVNNAEMMFYMSNMSFDLVEHLESIGRTIDFSNATSLWYTFSNCQFTRIGVISAEKCTSTYLTDQAFRNATKLVTIDGIICSDKTVFNDNAFNGSSALQNITFSGTLATSGLALRNSTKLSRASIESLINVYDKDAVVSATLSKAAVNTAFETSTGAADGSTSAAWLALLATKPNLTISLV